MLRLTGPPGFASAGAEISIDTRAPLLSAVESRWREGQWTRTWYTASRRLVAVSRRQSEPHAPGRPSRPRRAGTRGSRCRRNGRYSAIGEMRWTVAIGGGRRRYQRAATFCQAVNLTEAPMRVLTCHGKAILKGYYKYTINWSAPLSIPLGYF